MLKIVLCDDLSRSTVTISLKNHFYAFFCQQKIKVSKDLSSSKLTILHETKKKN
jgi:hypothetical protein